MKNWLDTMTFEKVKTGKDVIKFYEFREYKGKNGQIYKKEHIYFNEKNEEILSPSKFGQILAKPALIPWACNVMAEAILNREMSVQEAKSAWKDERDESARLGKVAHLLIQEYIEFKIGKRKKMPKMPKEDFVRNCYMAFREWERDNDVKFVNTEKMVYSKRDNFAGRLDIEAIVNGKFSLIDVKTGKGIYIDHIYQQVGYDMANDEMGCRKYEEIILLSLSKTEAEYREAKFKSSYKLKKAVRACLYLSRIEEEAKSLTKYAKK